MMTLLDKLKVLGFSKKTGNILNSNTSYEIKIQYNSTDETKSIIDYGDKIKNSHKGSLLLKKPENLVVLECVIRLLQKGYLPENLVLEKTWKSGHATSGRVDVMVMDVKKKCYALVECKTWGEEYSKERNNTLEDGGQLLSYLNFEDSTKTLILYASKIENKCVKIQAEAIDATLLTGTNSDERFISWNKSFIPNGIFDVKAKPYFSQKYNLIKEKLQELDKETGTGLFNSFAEILRRHTVSDKSNAFNKIFNLFVCKIYDEDTKKTLDELDFQWKVNDTPEELISRLGNLYIKGLNDYLQIDIDEDYFTILSEFSFKDIFDEDSYKENFTILREVIELLQGFQIKYTSKHQYLGDFFENLLTSGIKQEAGQYFTPIPLARFFLKSLPIKQIIQNNIDNLAPKILPYIIDNSCGAGHFLTEAIEEIEEEILKVKIESIKGKAQQDFKATKENFLWAKEYVYGVEKDYRLAKTTKIAMFLNGDGDATIINGDGLDDFYHSKTYSGLLKSKTETNQIEKFNILVANPPFSIPGFKKYLKNGNKNFTLYNYLSAKSSEIECVFLERLNQLLVEGGSSGIILPLSILNSDNKIYVEARKSLLINFELKGLVELRDKTFIATNTTTVGIFLKKRKLESIKEKMMIIYHHFVDGKEDLTIKKAISKIKKQLDWYKIDKSIIIKFFTENSLEKSLFKKGNFDFTKFPVELGYLLIAILNDTSETVIAYSGEKKEQEEFLGYRFSKGRGTEGCDPITDDEGFIVSKLFDPEDLYNNNKINSHIRASFENEKNVIPKSLKNNLNYIETILLFKEKNFILNNPSAYFESENYVIESNSQTGDYIESFELREFSLTDLIKTEQLEFISGLVYSKKNDEVPNKTSKKVLTASNLDLKTGKLVYDKIIHLKNDFVLPKEMMPIKNDIVFCKSSGSLKHLGKVVFVNEDSTDSVIGGFLSIIRVKDKKLAKAIFYRLLSLKFRKYAASLRDQNINNLNLSELKLFKLELPKDIDKFYDVATKKEKELYDIETKLKNLKKI